MAYSVKVSHRQGAHKPSAHEQFEQAVSEYASTPNKDVARRSLLERFGGRGAEQIIKASLGTVELV